ATTGLAALASCGGSDDADNPGRSSAGQLVVANADDSIAVCEVLEDGGIRECRAGPVRGLNAPGSIHVADGLVYVSNLDDHSLTVCRAAALHTADACKAAAMGDTLSVPLGVTVSHHRLYVSNDDGGVVGCELDQQGLPTHCSDAAPAGRFINPMGTAVHGGR